MSDESHLPQKADDEFPIIGFDERFGAFTDVFKSDKYTVPPDPVIHKGRSYLPTLQPVKTFVVNLCDTQKSP